uniref:Poly [ADP-ribose] polymerase n=1 Tax=Cyprinus carpio TaxID=7962 RepID=A0A8C2G128_CYPCA
MTVFENCTVVLDVKNLPFKEKNKLRLALLENGGNISYVINKECSFVVTSSVNDLSVNRQRSVQKLQVPVVGTQYVWSCLDQGHLLPLTEHSLTPQCALVFYHCDHDLPEFPAYFQVAKYSVFERVKPKTLSVLELQSAKGRAGQQYRVLCSILREAETAVVQDKLVFCVTSEDAVEAYLQLMKEMETEGYRKTHTLSPEVERLPSYSLQQLLLEEKLNCSTLSQEVGVFVELVWTEALGSLNNILTVPVSRISLNDVSREEGLLLQAQKTEKEDEVKALLEEVNTLLPLRMIDPPSKHKLVSQKLDLCQLIRDIVNVSEATLGSPSPSSLGKYRALTCSIEVVPPQNPEFHVVSQLLKDGPFQIQQILRVSRGVELQLFREDLGNIKPLLHSTSPSSFVGILSRGLLLPRVGVEQHGIERTDIGNLGGGIYFSDSVKTSVKYSKPSVTDGSRLLLVCEVALGRCKDLLKKDTTLTCAPDGYHSVHGVQRSPNRLSEFEDDEFVVYNTEQIRLKYVVQYSLEGDELKEFQPQINTQLTDTTPDILSSDDSEGLESTKNPLEEMNAGLLDSSGQKLPLQAVNVRCKLMDLLCQVIIFQTYTNQSAVPIEAKYVFPLEETAAVCGFEAFINGKHVIGKVKEKEQARKEYKQAIEKGHGAYLMDQDAPDVFTISVGNLPPGATVLIKVTFITELVVRSGSIVFSLSGSVAPWQQRAALYQTTQATVEKIGVTEEFCLSMSIEMPYEIINLSSSHGIKTKRTDCKAVISTLPGQTLGSEGLQVSFSLSNIHMPRMWVENHPDKDSQACMLVFYPDFKSSGVSGSGGPSNVSDVVILLDSSRSMQGDTMLNARRIALQVLKSLDRSLKINIISFSTDYREAFPAPVGLDEASEEARKFIMSCGGSGGSTDLWRPLRSLSLLPPCRGVRNILLLSDGHVQNQPLTLQLVRENSSHTRLFTCGLSLTANRHMLRALAQAGGGTYEFFDTKMKHTWTEKVRAQVQRMESLGCRSVAVKWQQFNPTAPPPVQAPSQLHALFSDCHTLLYGFVPHCTQATLYADLSGQEIKTMVSTTELQKTKGTFLHKLTARAIIRDYEDGILANSEAEHEGKKAEIKTYIIELSKEFSILSQFTSFVAIEEREQNELDTGFTDIPKIISEEDVDILPYMGWTEEKLKAVHISSTTTIGASMDALRPPCSRSLRQDLMEPLSKIQWISSHPSFDPMMSRTGSSNDSHLISPATQLFSSEPPRSYFSRSESGEYIDYGLHSQKERTPVICPTSSTFSWDTEIYRELDTSTRTLFTGPPHPPQLASQPSMSMTPSPDPPPASSRRSCTPFSRRRRAGSPIVFDQPVLSAPPSLSESGGFGGFLLSTNGPLGFGSSSSGFSVFSFGASQQQQKHLVFSAPGKYTHNDDVCLISYYAGTKGMPMRRDNMDLSLPGKPIRRPDTVAWNELFEFQHEDGYWECTDRLSSFLNLDVDFFANVFLQEKGIRSFGVKAHAEILRLVATLLVLQLIRVKKLAVGQLLESLLRLKESQEPRPMYWEAVKRAVDWACRADRQYPCVCSRLEIGWDWESSTRQLLGCDSPHPYSSLKPVLERRMDVSVI